MRNLWDLYADARRAARRTIIILRISLGWIVNISTTVLRWDFTHYFDFSPMSFAMAKPLVTPSLLSFYYPLNGFVWTGILLSVLAVSFISGLITWTGIWPTTKERRKMDLVVLDTFGSLVGQGVYGRVLSGHSLHILVCVWLFFGVVVSTAYRGSLIASLTLPSMPTRPETVEDLITAVKRVTFESYGSAFTASFSVSGKAAYSTLADMIELGVPVMDGLTQVLEKGIAHLDKRQYLELLIAEHFMRPDGTTSLYVGEERIFSTVAAWPIPHDAPYKPAIDRSLMAVTEAGLYEQWRKEILEKTTRMSRRKRQKEQKKQEEKGRAVDNSSSSKRLSLTHVQGPFLLLILGLAISSLGFIAEKSVGLPTSSFAVFEREKERETPR